MRGLDFVCCCSRCEARSHGQGVRCARHHAGRQPNVALLLLLSGVLCCVALQVEDPELLQLLQASLKPSKKSKKKAAAKADAAAGAAQ